MVFRSKLLLGFAASLTLALAVSTAVALDDSDCTYKSTTLGCQPAAFCSLQLKTGDAKPSDSCRLRLGVNVNKTPQQMHVAYAGATAGTGITVSWATFDPVGDSTVWISTDQSKLVQRNDVRVESFTYYSEGSYSLYQHHAQITGLTPNTKYYYVVGSANDTTTRSAIASFKTARAASDATPFDIAVYGDLGWGTEGSLSGDWLNAHRDNFEMAYHLGDISYADDDYLAPGHLLGFFYEHEWNDWMNSLTPFMSQVPYMTVVGNHEAECHSPACQASKYKRAHLGNYTAYNGRFRMPASASGGALNMWYSFETGPIHFTSVSSETDFPDAPSNAYNIGHPADPNGNFGNQLAWLEADLKKAVANRKNVPWIVVGMHRPLYQKKYTDGNGNPTDVCPALQAAFEKLFIKYNVDVVFAGHAHSYERDLPIATRKPVLDGVSADKKTYTNVKAPIYVVTGAPGNPEPNSGSCKSNIPWNVVESTEYGISTVHVTRNSLSLKFVTTTTASSKVLDEFVVIKS